jgi:hypothetical protein
VATGVVSFYPTRCVVVSQVTVGPYINRKVRPDGHGAYLTVSVVAPNSLRSNNLHQPSRIAYLPQTTHVNTNFVSAGVATPALFTDFPWKSHVSSEESRGPTVSAI